MKPKKIIFVDHFPGKKIGGGEEYLLTVASGIVSLGHSVSIVCLPGSGLQHEAEKRHLKTMAIPFLSNNFTRSVKALYKAFILLKPDLVNTHGFFSNLVGRMAARMAGIDKVFSTIHTEVTPKTFNFPKNIELVVRNFIESATSKNVEYIAVSKSIKEQLLNIGVRESSIHVIYPGLSGDLFELSAAIFGSKTYAAKKRITLGSCGRLEKVKDYPTLIQAFKLLVSEGIEAELILFGEGSQERRLKNLARKFGLEELVSFPGYRDDLLFKEIDVFCSTSLSEGFNIALLKAQAFGLPAVATSVGGQKEIIRDGKTGFLVEPRNPEKFKEAIKRMLQNREMLVEFSKNARKNALRFSAEDCIKKHAAVFGLI